MQFLYLLAIVGVAYGKWKPDPMPEEGTSLAVFNTNPAVINARKMTKLMHNQDVVTTCRYMLFKLPKKFHDAKAACSNLTWPITNTGIGMASVQNKAENKDIMSLIRLAFGIKFNNDKPYSLGNWVLIGLSKRRNNDYKPSKKEKGVFVKEDWYYPDNSMAQYEHFRKGMPDQQSQGKKDKEWQNWVQVNKKGWWDDTYASKALPYTCQYCGKYIVLSAHVNWDAAKAHCEDVGLRFATVNSEQDNKELLFAATITLGEELGGRRFNNSNWVWIGEHEVMDDQDKGTDEWVHYDGEEWADGFTPKWDRKSQPDNYILMGREKHTEQRVVALSRKDGKWDDSFKHKKRPFACQCPDQACTFQ